MSKPRSLVLLSMPSSSSIAFQFSVNEIKDRNFNMCIQFIWRWIQTLLKKSRCLYFSVWVRVNPLTPVTVCSFLPCVTTGAGHIRRYFRRSTACFSWTKEDLWWPSGTHLCQLDTFGKALRGYAAAFSFFFFWGLSSRRESGFLLRPFLTAFGSICGWSVCDPALVLSPPQAEFWWGQKLGQI